MTGTAVVAVDFGAASVRVCRIDVASARPELEVLHRVSHGPIAGPDGVLHWDWDRLVAAMFHGVALAADRGPIASIGVDAWGVDYGLIGNDGQLVESPVSYRDPRTTGYRDVVSRIGERRLYEIAGLQLMPINTIFQLAVHDRGAIDQAARVVMLPELLAWHLAGRVTAEVTSAGTTGLLDVTTGGWSDELLEAIGVAPSLFPPIERPGSLVGHWKGVPVHLVGGHDTASAVLGGAGGTDAFVSAGTWLLVGREQPEPDTSELARAGRFTNEQGAAGGIRLLRNVAGWWLIEESRRAWSTNGSAPALDLDTLLADASRAAPTPAADATDERFLAPADMPGELLAAAGLPPDASPAVVARCAIESMAASTAAVLDQLGARSVTVFGGGSRAPLYVDLLRARGYQVRLGPVEATALGNAIAQSLALGVFADVPSARAALAPTMMDAL